MEKWAKGVEKNTFGEFQERCKGRLVGTEIRQKKKKLSGGDENNGAQTEYPKAMNELENYNALAQQEDSENEDE